MRFGKRLFLLAGLAAILLGGKPAGAQTVQHVEFSEVSLAHGTDLTGRTDFSPFGLSIQNSLLVIDPRLVGAGTDDHGISTNGVGTVQFAADVSGLTVYTGRIAAPYVATALDVNNNVLQTLTLPSTGTSSAVNVPLTFAGISGIRSLQFSAGGPAPYLVAIGRLDYTLGPTASNVPEPSSAALILPALGAFPLLKIRRRKRSAPSC